MIKNKSMDEYEKTKLKEELNKYKRKFKKAKAKMAKIQRILASKSDKNALHIKTCS